jgi:hypothetical protein
MLRTDANIKAGSLKLNAPLSNICLPDVPAKNNIVSIARGFSRLTNITSAIGRWQKTSARQPQNIQASDL